MPSTFHHLLHSEEAAAAVAHANFRSAYAQGNCHLCHAPLREINDNRPCPHWLLSAYKSEHRVRQIFAAYDLCDVVAYLLLFDGGGRKQFMQRSSPRADIVRATEHLTLRLHVNYHQWIFDLPLAAHSARFSIELQHLRTGRDHQLSLDYSPRDKPMLARLAAAPGHNSGTVNTAS